MNARQRRVLRRRIKRDLPLGTYVVPKWGFNGGVLHIVVDYGNPHFEYHKVWVKPFQLHDEISGRTLPNKLRLLSPCNLRPVKGIR